MVENVISALKNSGYGFNLQVNLSEKGQMFTVRITPVEGQYIGKEEFAKITALVEENKPIFLPWDMEIYYVNPKRTAKEK